MGALFKKRSKKMTQIQISLNDFISQFPEFANNERAQGMLTRATCYISLDNYGYLTEDCRVLAVYLFAAHLLTLQDNVSNGNTSGGIEQSATIDKVSVTMAIPTSHDAFEYWLNQTAYGQELLALLASKIATPLYVNGSFNRVLF